MSEYTTIHAPVEVTVYKVEDNNGCEADFTVDVDVDGDLIISVDTTFGEDWNEETVRDWLCENDNLQDVIENACDQYARQALDLLLSNDFANNEILAPYFDWVRVDAFVNNLDDVQKDELRKALSK